MALPFRDLFADQAWPAGFSYRAELFSTAEELRFSELFKTLPLKPFAFHGYQTGG